MPDQPPHKIREDDDAYYSECDWGHCPGIATWWRYDDVFDVELPVCGRCAHIPDSDALLTPKDTNDG